MLFFRYVVKKGPYNDVLFSQHCKTISVYFEFGKQVSSKFEKFLVISVTCDDAIKLVFIKFLLISLLFFFQLFYLSRIVIVFAVVIKMSSTTLSTQLHFFAAPLLVKTFYPGFFVNYTVFFSMRFMLFF